MVCKVVAAQIWQVHEQLIHKQGSTGAGAELQKSASFGATFSIPQNGLA